MKELDLFEIMDDTTAIRRYDLNGNYIDEFNDIDEASTYLNIPKYNIQNVLNGRRKSTNNYLFKEVAKGSEKTNIAPRQFVKDEGHPKAVLQINLNGEIINEYPSIKKAAKLSGINKRSISDTLYNRQKTAGGYIWRFIDD